MEAWGKSNENRPGVERIRLVRFVGNPEVGVGQHRYCIFKRPYALTALAEDDNVSHV